MSAPFIIPFNFCPTSTSLKTAAYTMPAGKYACVVTISPFFLINGVLLNGSETVSMSTSTTTVATDSAITSMVYSSPVHVFSSSLTRGGTATGTVGGNFGGGSHSIYNDTLFSVSRTTNGTTVTPHAIDGNSDTFWGAMTHSETSVGTLTASYTISYYYFKNLTSTKFWVPSGTVLNGNNYVVSEYNMIS
jgi:hypothetical protein